VLRSSPRSRKRWCLALPASSWEEKRAQEGAGFRHAGLQRRRPRPAGPVASPLTVLGGGGSVLAIARLAAHGILAEEPSLWLLQSLRKRRPRGRVEASPAPGATRSRPTPTSSCRERWSGLSSCQREAVEHSPWGGLLTPRSMRPEPPSRQLHFRAIRREVRPRRACQRWRTGRIARRHARFHPSHDQELRRSGRAVHGRVRTRPSS
jgi:hypothetical protein